MVANEIDLYLVCLQGLPKKCILSDKVFQNLLKDIYQTVGMWGEGAFYLI